MYETIDLEESLWFCLKCGELKTGKEWHISYKNLIYLVCGHLVQHKSQSVQIVYSKKFSGRALVQGYKKR